jgi:hypothetical protein
MVLTRLAKKASKHLAQPYVKTITRKRAQRVTPKVCYSYIVKELRQSNNRLQLCQQEKNIVRQCLLSKYYLSSMQWAPLLEKHIKEKFSISSPTNNTSGDGCSPKKKNIEIKVSLGTMDGSFNFVQIRPDHHIHYYLFLAYDVYFGKEGKVYWFLCKPHELYRLLPQYGTYAHGTISKLGKITQQNLKGRNIEYALRPSPRAQKTSKQYTLWQVMLKRFQSTEASIHKLI